jgi:hypothetical protein
MYKEESVSDRVAASNKMNTYIMLCTRDIRDNSGFIKGCWRYPFMCLLNTSPTLSHVEALAISRLYAQNGTFLFHLCLYSDVIYKV